MNAIIPELIISPSEGRPRTLRICWDPTKTSVAMYGPTGFGSRYNFAIAPHDECRLDLTYDHLLWIGSSCFDLTQAESLQVRMVLEPLGLRIQTLDSTPPAVSSSPAGYESTTTVARSLDVDGGTTPPALGQAGGSLEPEIDCWVRALSFAGAD